MQAKEVAQRKLIAHRYKLLKDEVRYAIVMDVRYASGGAFKGHVVDVVLDQGRWHLAKWAEGFATEDRDEGADMEALQSYVRRYLGGMSSKELLHLLAMFRRGAEFWALDINSLWQLEDSEGAYERQMDAWASMEAHTGQPYV
jgi:hypothetical protein